MMKSIQELNLTDVFEAHKILSPILAPTPLVRNEFLSDHYGCDVYLKLEIAQPIGSFKIRGASYRISKLSDEEKKRGVIAASAGNHAQGVAWGARKFGTSALIVMPVTAPLTKIQNTRALGAEVRLMGNNYDEAYQAAQEIIQSTGRTYLHAFHDADVICGQGTTALEILDQCPDADFVVTSIGGGGLTAGMGIVFRERKPDLKLVGCQALQSNSMVTSLRQGAVSVGNTLGTFADGINVKVANSDLFQLLKGTVSHMVDADEDEIASNVLRFMEKAKLVVEGSGAIVLSALDRLHEKMKGKKVVLVVSGGNIDLNLVSRIIDRGLKKSGRRLHLNVQISDRPGSLARLTALIAETQANVVQVIHDRNDLTLKFDETEVELVLETRGPSHAEEVIEKIKSHAMRMTVLK